MRVLIAGCGYVGMALGRELAQQGHDVFGLRRNESARAALETAGIQPVFADVTRPGELDRLPLPQDWVVNCVASGGGGVEDYRRVYLEGTRNLLARLGSCPPQKFVYTSSTSVYGQTDGSIVDESSPVEPVAETARVLVETERLLCEAQRRTGFPAVILRLAGIYGPDRDYWFRQFASGQARLDEDGERFLNRIHRDDVVGCIIAALQRGRPGEIYNAVDDGPATQRALFEWLAVKSGKPMPPSAPGNPESRKRGTTNKRVSNRKLKSELGYRFVHPSFRQSPT